MAESVREAMSRWEPRAVIDDVRVEPDSGTVGMVRIYIDYHDTEWGFPVHDDQRLFEKISGHFDGNLAGKTLALWGLAFKPNTDDMREAPSRVLMEALWDAGATVRGYDPEAMEEARRLYPDEAKLVLCDSADEALAGADALAIVTEWQEFRSPDFDRIKGELAAPVIFDGRNLYEPASMARHGFVYHSIGRPTVWPA